ncbi:MTH1187 family thiamine-binding protein [Evansella cellulosilytica]|uniref:Thiamine-binding protein domain-containing protein n=1 Tax=Evansella cellulosilytica (strain ATCC 21833 / DSM 2522 / FERM P-1141 / JCM 9156 / N-4) TaxID=649639 RepID=E6TWY0_EVAC2|nr:MTH1187 family thiamine-binding protein [Evansella cellulosilytica]ADU29930.1 protein of unknown function DUF77 [Evansella cellulosilytica DSM 2522]
MVRGMSFQKGILFIGRKHIACSYAINEKQNKTWIKPISINSVIEISKLVLFSMPKWYFLLLSILLILVLVPKSFTSIEWEGIPYFALIFFLYGTHLCFPKQLKKYHGAEHKVFSYNGTISISRLRDIREAEITNRYCSTNTILLYFLSVIFLSFIILVMSPFHWLHSMKIAAYFSILTAFVLTKWLHKRKQTFLRNGILKGSYWLQKNVTTLEPDKKHMKTAIMAYRRLAIKEFPHRIKSSKTRKENKKMAIADVTVIPIGSSTTSVSEVVAEIHRLLKATDKDIHIELTPMSTLIEGDVSDLLEIIKDIHEVPFKLGHKRVATNIRIDDRRDKKSTMKTKLQAVQSKITISSDE